MHTLAQSLPSVIQPNNCAWQQPSSAQSALQLVPIPTQPNTTQAFGNVSINCAPTPYISPYPVYNAISSSAPQIYPSLSYPGHQQTIQPVAYAHAMPSTSGFGVPNYVPMGIKIQPPQMDRDCLDLWFVRLEHWFANNNGIADENKFYTLVGLLEHNQMLHVLGTAMTPPPKKKTINKYFTAERHHAPHPPTI